MRPYIDLKDKKFGRLLVSYRLIDGKYSRWLCICDCGTRKFVESTSLTSGRTRSCGCLNRESAIKRFTLHGAAAKDKMPEYRTWSSMKYRCYNKKNKAFAYYGGRGIKVCFEWKNDFLAFYHDMGPRPNGMSLDRIDHNGDYSPSNCRWATPTQQTRNRRNVLLYTINGETKALAEWCDLFKVKYKSVWGRINLHGESIRIAIAYSKQHCN